MPINLKRQMSIKWFRTMAMSWRILPATTGFMIKIQDLVTSNNNYKHILKDLNITNYICRKCQEKLETIQHIIGACCTLAQGNYTHHHNHFVHQELGIKCGLSKGIQGLFIHISYNLFERIPIINSAMTGP
jgi:hypothetical protein